MRAGCPSAFPGNPGRIACLLPCHSKRLFPLQQFMQISNLIFDQPLIWICPVFGREEVLQFGGIDFFIID